MTNVMNSRSGCSSEAFSAVIQHGNEVISAAEAVARSGGSVLKAPQRRRGGTPPRSVNAKLRKHPYPCILRHENPVLSPPRIETTKLRRRSREAGAPSSRRLCQSLLGRLRGGTARGGSCRLREAGAPSSRRPSAAEGALPRERKPARTATLNRASSDTKIPVSAPLRGKIRGLFAVFGLSSL